jgi:hypothetical protein
VKYRAVLVACLLPALSHAQTFQGGYPFSLPARDTSTQRFLPAFPARAIDEFVTIGPDFNFAVNGAPIRFFGTNVGADGAFPPASSTFIAGRLRKLGFNLLRLHHLDNPWSTGSLFVQGSDTRHLNPVTLDRLQAFIAALKSNGIYVNVNLHVSRTFKAADGVAGADSLPEMGKGVSYFDPQLRALHKEYARQLLTATNPYTGLALVDDPVMAMVEITNENSLYRKWRDGMLKTFAEGGELMVRHAALLDSLWNDFLLQKYGSDAALAAAWGTGDGGEGTNQIANSTFEDVAPGPPWMLELHAPLSGSMSRTFFQPANGVYCAAVSVTGSDGVDWHAQWKHVGLSMVKDSVYTISFLARAETDRTVGASIMLEGSPWTSYGWFGADLTAAWKRFSFSFKAPVTVTGGLRLSFGVGQRNGLAWFDDVSVAAASLAGLRAGESLAGRTVRRIDFPECVLFTDPRVRDMSEFYLVIQREYLQDMMTFLKNDLGVRVPIVGTNWSTGLADISAQSGNDYVDNHSYWDHPSFPGIPWSPTDWVINNTPMVQTTGGGTIPWLMAAIPSAGKPFTISEYNHPFPNRYQTEGMLFFTAYSSFHDADAIMVFDYNGGTEWEADMVNSFFSINRNTAMTSLMPSLAHAYRNFFIAPARNPLFLRWGADDVLLSPKRDPGGWVFGFPFDPTLALRYALRNETFSAPGGSNLGSLPPPPVNPYVTETGEVTWNTSGLLAVAADRCVAATGFLPNFLGRRIGAAVLAGADRFATFTWIPLDEEPLRRSRRTLLTLSTRTQNTGMVWDGTTTIHDDWGIAPTTMERGTLTLRVNVVADSMRVVPLGPTGEAAGTGTSYMPADTNTFLLIFNQFISGTPWFGIEAYGGDLNDVSDGSAVPAVSRLDQNYPNPFNPETSIPFQIAGGGHVSLRIFDVLGREAANLVDEVRAAGRHTVVFDASHLASGPYYCRLSINGLVQTRRMMVLK